jgi:hypothetical protein
LGGCGCQYRCIKKAVSGTYSNPVKAKARADIRALIFSGTQSVHHHMEFRIIL